MKNHSQINYRQIKTIKIVTIVLSMLFLITSLTQNAYFLDEQPDSVGSFGLFAFLFGWMNLFGPGVAWLANPFLIRSWIMLIGGNSNKSLLFSIISVLFALSFTLFSSVIATEGGGHKDIVSYGIGYYLWLISCGISVIGNLVLYFNSRNSRKHPFEQNVRT